MCNLRGAHSPVEFNQGLNLFQIDFICNLEKGSGRHPTKDINTSERCFNCMNYYGLQSIVRLPLSQFIEFFEAKKKYEYLDPYARGVDDPVHLQGEQEVPKYPVTFMVEKESTQVEYKKRVEREVGHTHTEK